MPLKKTKPRVFFQIDETQMVKADVLSFRKRHRTVNSYAKQVFVDHLAKQRITK